MKRSTVAAVAMLAGVFAGPAAAAEEAAATAAPPLSTDCDAVQAPGSATVGKGPRGCHFRLYNPETHQVLAHTPYSLRLYPPYDDEYEERPAPVLAFEGVTDAQGRSAYVRATFAIEPYQLYFVQKIGSGPRKWETRLARATDGRPLWGIYYKVEWCGEPYAGVTDPQGHGVEFHTTDPNCRIHPTFYYGKWQNEIPTFLSSGEIPK